MQQTRLIIVGLCGHEGVFCGELEESLVALQLLVAEDAKGGVTGAVALNHRGRPLAEDLSLLLSALTFGEQRPILALRVIQLLEALVDGHHQVVHAIDLVAHLTDGASQFLIPALRSNPVELNESGGGFVGELEALDGPERNDLAPIGDRVHRHLGTQRPRAGSREQVAAHRQPRDEG